jgi:hypothetical protein
MNFRWNRVRQVPPPQLTLHSKRQTFHAKAPDSPALRSDSQNSYVPHTKEIVPPRIVLIPRTLCSQAEHQPEKSKHFREPAFPECLTPKSRKALGMMGIKTSWPRVNPKPERTATHEGITNEEKLRV